MPKKIGTLSWCNLPFLRANGSIVYWGIVLLLLSARSVLGQETVFDVPSADILDEGKVYGELDGTVRVVDPLATFTPRIVVGIGHQVEVGANLNGLSAPTVQELNISPTAKWRVWSARESGWSFLVGDNLFFPVYKRTYEVGNYAYAFFSKEWKRGTRIGFGGYNFTKHVVATGNRSGGQFTAEQTLNHRLTLAAEWYTGKQAVGYVNIGSIIKLTSKLTLYTAYQIGNYGVTTGNHQFLWEFGYNFN
jgi:hypothetical protein